MKTHVELKFKIKGVSPLIMHNGHLADPLNEYAKRMKEISGKRKKTEADYRALADIEWEGGLYLDEDCHIGIPGDNIESALISGGKKSNLGDAFKAGLFCEGFHLLEYGGPKDIAKLKGDKRFWDTRGVKIKKNRIMRTRPIFPVWSLSFSVMYLPDLLNPDQVIKSLETVGRIIGLGDFKPKYGRFVVEKAG